jgi:hypothetical protein
MHADLSDSPSHARLILYATPRGVVADVAARYFDPVSEPSTIAQRYPPHCSLTGYFSVEPEHVEPFVAATASGEREGVVTTSVRLEVRERWIGLGVEPADELQRIARRFARETAGLPGRLDDLRLKSWMHLSLAYGHDPRRHDELALVAQDLFDGPLSVDWRVALHERRGAGWIVHPAPSSNRARQVPPPSSVQPATRAITRAARRPKTDAGPMVEPGPG